MCGVWGVVLPSEPDRVIGAAGALAEALEHRGPDDRGAHLDEGLAIGATRLAIVDREGGRQPFASRDGRLVGVVNGEIYNATELRAALVGRGHRFATGSDCEVVLHLYEEEGSAFVDRLRGMFAFAVLDRVRRTIVLGRDRLGEKPLYYHASAKRFVFASELAAMVASGLVPFRLDGDAVQDYFHFQFVPEPATPIEGVRKLPPGHLLTLNLETMDAVATCYWAIEDCEPIDADPEEALIATLEDVQGCVFTADVPVGVSLSGGLDSALVGALLARARPGKGHAFTVGYEGRPAHDERADARRIAEILGLRFHELELSVADVVSSFPAVVAAGDDPIADTAAPGYNAVAAAAHREGVPVLAQGQGGDELFWGYGWVREAGQRALREMPAPGAPLAFYEINPGFKEARASSRLLFTDAFLAARDPDRPARTFTRRPGEPPGAAVTRLIMSTYLLENGMAQGDRQAMANSVELRLPLMDARLVSVALGLQRAVPDVDDPPKDRLRRVARAWLPGEVVDRPKRPFETPVRQWSDALYAEYGPLLDGGLLVELDVLRPDVAALLPQDRYDASRATPPSYKALVLELWLRHHLGHNVRTANNH